MKCTHSIFVFCVFSLCIANLTFAQASNPDRGTVNSWLGLLRTSAVQAELEIVEDQKRRIERLQNEMWQEMRDRMSELRGQDLDPSERRERYSALREEMEERQLEYKDELEEILLPIQVKRLKELQFQNQARRNGDGAMGVLKNQKIIEELGISESQQQELEEKAEEVRKKLEEKIRKLKMEAEEEVLSVLTSSQRTQLRELIGETFDFGRRSGRRVGRGQESRGGTLGGQDRN